MDFDRQAWGWYAAAVGVVIAIALVAGYAMSGGWGRGVEVLEATYGWNCNGITSQKTGLPLSVEKGNVTKAVQSACNGKRSCQLTVDVGRLGDPAPTCAKDFAVAWHCGSDQELRTATIAAEANGKTATLGCPAAKGGD